MRFSELDGIGPVTEKKLNDVGISDTFQLLTHGPSEISEISGMDLESAIQLFGKVRKKMKEDSERGRKTGKQIEEDRSKLDRISTGTKALDKLFSGGIECQATIETYGEFGSGKTQFIHTMAVRAQLPKEDGGLECRVFYVDTEGTFRPERIRAIAEKLNMDADKVLENIIVEEPSNSAEQYMILQELENDIQKENFRLIIIDSATGLYRSDYIGRGNLSNRQNQLNKFVTLAGRISREYNCSIILTNQVMKDPGKFFGDPTKPIGGDIFAHASTYRVYFSKSGKNRTAKMVDSPSHAEVEVMFALNDRGVVDVEVRDEDDKLNKKPRKKKGTLDE